MSDPPPQTAHQTTAPLSPEDTPEFPPYRRPPGRPVPQTAAGSFLQSPQWAGVGVLVSILIAILLAIWQFHTSNTRGRTQAGIQAMYEWNRLQPPNDLKCMQLGAALSFEAIESISERKATEVPTTLDPAVKARLSDFDDDPLSKLYADFRLTARGAYTIAVRLNKALEADNTMAIFALRGLADDVLLKEELGRPICRDDPELLNKVRKLKGREHSYRALAELVSELTYPGCPGSFTSNEPRRLDPPEGMLLAMQRAW